jgi:hypothetical protein
VINARIAHKPGVIVVIQRIINQFAKTESTQNQP